MPIVIPKIENAKLLVIGEGEYKKYLEKITNSINLEDCVEFLGSKSHAELADYYNLADAFVLPSATTKIGTEGLGLVLLEAMACGTCVIGSSSGGIKDVIRHGTNGLIFQEKNSEDLANNIIKILKDSRLRKRLSKNGLKYAKQNYDWGIISKKFLRIYSHLLK